MFEQMGAGTLIDFPNIARFESNIDEGQRCQLVLDLRSSLPASAAAELENQLKQRGVEEARVTNGTQQVAVTWRKGFPWLAVIASIILALIVLAILIIGWVIFKEVVPDALQPVFGTLIIVAAVLFGALALKKKLR